MDQKIEVPNSQNGIQRNFFNQDTLVKYEYPVVVSTYEKTEAPAEKPSPRDSSGLADGIIIDLDKRQTEETLNVILPPREWEYEGQLWRQKVSSTPATRSDVIALEEQLNTKLKQRQAKPFGICPIRRALYLECFDELIRQIAINCSERGLLLTKVRDEANMTIAAYRSLYESAIAHGIRKALTDESRKVKYTETLTTNAGEKARLMLEVRELEQKLTDLEQSFVDRKAAEDQKHAEYMEYLRAINDQIKHQLESIIIPPKKGSEPPK